MLSVAPPLLERLVKNLGETAHLSVLQGTEVLTVLSESPSHAVRADGWAGRTVIVHCTSSGRVLLFDHDRDALSDLLSGVELRELGPRTVRSVEELYERLVAARAEGYALVDEEFEVGLVGAAAPVRDFKGRLVAALNVSAPKFRLGERLESAGHRKSRGLRTSSPTCSAGPPIMGTVMAIPLEHPDMQRRSVRFSVTGSYESSTNKRWCKELESMVVIRRLTERWWERR